MYRTAGAIVALSLCLVISAVVTSSGAQSAAPPSWNPRAAAAYLDSRQTWWESWPSAKRDHDTYCISCHTPAPYAVARPVLRIALGESGPSEIERRLADNVTKRVRMWRDVEPYYPDQTRGLPKTSESRGTEAVLNALILSSRDAHAGKLSDEGRMALDNLWALQFKSGERAGGWAWLNFHDEPWEADDAPYFGASLGAVAIGMAPGGYASSPDLQDRVKLLREYLHRGADTPHLFNRTMILWASSKLPGVLSATERQAAIDALVAKQQADGGWATSSLAGYKRKDGSAVDPSSDGYATGLISFALQEAGVPRTQPSVARGLAWLETHQDLSDGRWSATSLNKQRDPASDPGKFMSDAATAFAVLALTETAKP